jgi:hypothetical protein
MSPAPISNYNLLSKTVGFLNHEETIQNVIVLNSFDMALFYFLIRLPKDIHGLFNQ